MLKTVEDMILLTLSYLRSYCAFLETGMIFDVSKSTAHLTTVWVEDFLIASRQFALPSKQVLVTEITSVEVVLVYLTEQ